jgi:hypothetical protein
MSNPLTTFLDAIRDHLDLHVLPAAVAVDVSTGLRPVVVQLEADDLPGVAAGLLRWAGTLDDVSASLWRVPGGESVHLSVTGRMPCGTPVYVYGGVRFAETVFPDLPAGIRQDMPLFVLRGWTTLGEVAA